jgi:hypothetical protein
MDVRTNGLPSHTNLATLMPHSSISQELEAQAQDLFSWLQAIAPRKANDLQFSTTANWSGKDHPETYPISYRKSSMRSQC